MEDEEESMLVDAPVEELLLTEDDIKVEVHCDEGATIESVVCHCDQLTPPDLEQLMETFSKVHHAIINNKKGFQIYKKPTTTYQFFYNMKSKFLFYSW